MPGQWMADRDSVYAQVIALRLAGLPYRAIGRQLTIAAMSAFAMVQEEISSDGPYAAALRQHELGCVDQQLAHLTQRRAELVGAHGQQGAAP